MTARVRVSLISWEGGSYAVLFMVPFGLSGAGTMSQTLWLPFEYFNVKFLVVSMV